MNDLLLVIHIFGGIIVLGYALISMFSAKMYAFKHIKTLLGLTFVQSLTGLGLTFTSLHIDTWMYCGRGVLYFTFITMALWMMYQRLNDRPAFAQVSVFVASLGVYFVPLLSMV